MQIALAVGTMLLGGWVLNSPSQDEDTAEPLEAPAATTPSGPSSKVPAMPPGEQYQKRPDRSRPRGSRLQNTPRSAPNGPGEARSPFTQGASTWPSAPTSAMPLGGVVGQPTAPTSGGARGPVPVTGEGAYYRREPTAPTAPPGQFAPVARSDSTQRLFNEMNRNRLPTGVGPSITPAPAAPEKAFAGYRPPSGVSPYMNLFRSQNDSLDNYTSLVRPQLEQRFLNQQFGRDIRGLERNTRSQNVDLQQLYRTNQQLQGVATPQYYMNTGNFFPQQQGPQ
jgi:hypothetical protein